MYHPAEKQKNKLTQPIGVVCMESVAIIETSPTTTDEEKINIGQILYDIFEKYFSKSSIES